jgi:hypothetical protein
MIRKMSSNQAKHKRVKHLLTLIESSKSHSKIWNAFQAKISEHKLNKKKVKHAIRILKAYLRWRKFMVHSR